MAATSSSPEPLTTLREAPSTGRYIVASRPIPPGTLVHMSLPYVLTMHPQSHANRCRCCFGPISQQPIGSVASAAADKKGGGAKKGGKAAQSKKTSEKSNAAASGDCAGGTARACAGGCGVAFYCSEACEATYAAYYHSGGAAPTAPPALLAAETDATRPTTSNYYGEECRAARLIHRALGDGASVTKGRPAQDTMFLTLFVSVFMKAEAEARADLRAALAAALAASTEEGGSAIAAVAEKLRGASQAAQWLLTDYIVPTAESAAPPAAAAPSSAEGAAPIAAAGGASRLAQGTTQEPAEVAKIAARQAAIGAIEVADPQYFKFNNVLAPTSTSDSSASSSSSAQCREATATDRLRAAMAAVTDFADAALLKGSSSVAAAAGCSSSDAAPAGPFSPSVAGMQCHVTSSACDNGKDSECDASAALRNAITPRYGDLAAIVSNHAVIPKDRMGEYKTLFHTYNRLRKLMGFCGTAATANSEEKGAAAPKTGPKGKGKKKNGDDGAGADNAAETDKKLKRIKPGTNVSNAKRKLLDQQAAREAREAEAKKREKKMNKKKKRSADSDDDDDEDFSSDEESDFDEDTFDAVGVSAAAAPVFDANAEDVVPDFTAAAKPMAAALADLRQQQQQKGEAPIAAASSVDSLLAGLNAHPLFLPEVSESIFTSVCAGLQCNGFGVYDPSDRCAAVGFYPLASYFNHSCDPNLCRVMVGNEMRFYALRAIGEGEPLCISYIDVTDAAADRRRELLQGYRFYCRCPRCAGEGRLQCRQCEKCDARGYLRPLLGSSATECTVCRAIHPAE